MTGMGSITSIACDGGNLEWRISDGLTPYPDALAQMRARVAAIRAGTADELVWSVEHPPIYTAGTSAKPADLVDPGRFPAFDAGRGGQWTYHGPGQRTVYAMLDLTRPHGAVPVNDIHCYVNALESWLIGALDRFNVKGERRKGRVGIWVADRATGTEAKIGAIGVRVSRWVSWHGVALNVTMDLEPFSRINPCGYAGLKTVDLSTIGVQTTWDDAARVLSRKLITTLAP